MPRRPEPIADGVWRCAGDLGAKMNVFLIADGEGVTQFDGGTKPMTRQVARAAAELGGLRRIVLGHAHPDHRGTVPGLGVPVLCHPDEVADAESAGNPPYFEIDRIPDWWSRLVYPWLLRHWDGGPVEIDATVREGDRVAGFEVIHLPGHAPGLIALWRAEDRLALVSDAVYHVDSLRLRALPEERRPVVPDPVWEWDHERSIASVRKLAELEPATVWTGHEGPLAGAPSEVRARLERAADQAAAELGSGGLSSTAGAPSS